MNIDFDKGGGLVPAIVQDATTKRVLMLGYMNREAYEHTLATRLVTFFSRRHNRLWTKGETSGNLLHLVDISIDCDGDTLLIKAHPDGPVCHTGCDTCWGESNTADGCAFLTELQEVICQRKSAMPEGSYTTSLFTEGVSRIAQKVGEEALETAIEAVKGNDERMIYEAADLVYHLLVLLAAHGKTIDDVAAELRQRHNPKWKKH